MKQLPQIGERLVIHGMSGYTALVSSVDWDTGVFDWVIKLDWGQHGSSRVWMKDENKVWKRWFDLN